MLLETHNLYYHSSCFKQPTADINWISIPICSLVSMLMSMCDMYRVCRQDVNSHFQPCLSPSSLMNGVRRNSFCLSRDQIKRMNNELEGNSFHNNICTYQLFEQLVFDLLLMLVFLLSLPSFIPCPSLSQFLWK